MICSCKYLLSDFGPSVMLYFCCAETDEAANRTTSDANVRYVFFMTISPFLLSWLTEVPGGINSPAQLLQLLMLGGEELRRVEHERPLRPGDPAGAERQPD